MPRLSAALSIVTQFMLVSDPTEIELRFDGAGGLELTGTLVLPEGADGADVPALLLLPGSGPTDRNGNQPPLFVTDLLSDIAGHLAGEGIATFRFDKRAAHVHQADWPTEIDALADFFSYENFVGDVAAAYEVLRSHDGIDAARVGILGHSEGGLFALQVAADLADSDDRPAALVLAATAGRRLDDVLREQIGNLLAGQTPDETVRADMLAHLDRAIDAIREGGSAPADTPPGLASLFHPSSDRLLQAYFTVEPVELASGARGPVLVLQGGADVQVSAERDAPLLVDALSRRGEDAPFEHVVVPGVSHNFKRPTSDADPGLAGPVDAEVLAALTAWVRIHLGGDAR